MCEGVGPYDDDQEFDYAVDFVPNANQHATAVPERWSVEGGGWGPNPRSLNERNQNFKGVRRNSLFISVVFHTAALRRKDSAALLFVLFS